MKLLVTAVLLTFSQFLLSAGSGGQRPLFADYPANETFRGQPKPVDLNSHPKAREYRTRLREAAKGKPSFAAYYIVAEWGCGSPCQQVALVDARSGAVYYAPFTTALGNQHRLNSRLFIADAPEDISAYYEGKIPKDPLFTVARIGYLLSHKSDHAGAEEMYRRALAGYEQALGPENPKTLTSVTNLAVVLKEKGDLPGAVSLLSKVAGSSPGCLAGVRYVLACYECLSGNVEQATRLIAEEIAAKPVAREQALKDDDLKAIHDFIRGLQPSQTATDT